MKRLLAYLFIVFGLGLTFSVNGNAQRDIIFCQNNESKSNLYKAFINRLENNKAMKKHLDQIKNTETYKELEAYVVEFTGA